jgi:hypothetical protein
VVTLFSFQPGNGHLHSSKGIGRMIIGNVRIAERIRNRMVDNVNMSSLVILKADSANRNKLQPVVHAPFVVIDKSIEVDQQKFSADGEMYAALDQRMVNYMEQAAGAYVSANPNASGQPVTATEASQDAQRERENSDITEARWRDQFSQLVQTVQKRAFSDDHIKEARELFTKITEQFVTQGSDSNEVMKTITDLMDTTDESRLPVRTLVMMFMDGLTESEIRICRDAATSGYAHTDDAIVAQGILAVGRMYANNPNVDQVELTKRNVEALAGPDAAKALIIENPDQTIMAEATRMQQQEATTMMTLKMPVPVSPRDNHMAHAQVCMQLLIQAGQGISDLTTIDMFAKPTELLLNHFAEHLANYLAQGNPSQNPQFKEMNDFYKKFKSDFAQAVMIAEQQKMAAELVEQGATPEQVAAASNTQNPNLPPYSAGVGAPPTSPDMGMQQEGPDVEAIQTALAREAGEFAPPEIEERKKRAYYRPPGVE